MSHTVRIRAYVVYVPSTGEWMIVGRSGRKDADVANMPERGGWKHRRGELEAHIDLSFDMPDGKAEPNTVVGAG